MLQTAQLKSAYPKAETHPATTVLRPSHDAVAPILTVTKRTLEIASNACKFEESIEWLEKQGFKLSMLTSNGWKRYTNLPQGSRIQEEAVSFYISPKSPSESQWTVTVLLQGFPIVPYLQISNACHAAPSVHSEEKMFLNLRFYDKKAQDEGLRAQDVKVNFDRMLARVYKLGSRFSATLGESFIENIFGRQLSERVLTIQDQNQEKPIAKIKQIFWEWPSVSMDPGRTNELLPLVWRLMRE